MCFTPAISLTTAILEFILAIIIITRFKKTVISRFSALIIFLLGFYQLTEFLMCTNNPLIWSKIGFATYTFIPALVLHFAVVYTKRRVSPLIIYAMPAIFTIAALTSNFISGAECLRYFIAMKSLLYQNNILYLIYLFYYFGFIVISGFLLVRNSLNQKNVLKEAIALITLLGILIGILPALVFIILFPKLGIQFPSIWCEFAVITAIILTTASYLEGKTSHKNL
jgi:hypothetical protein